ncbi:MAG: hypothetical protein ABIH23_04775 [bacterium]
MTLMATILIAVLAAAQPLPLPDGFDFEGNVSVRGAAELAEQLLANGTAQDIATAERLLDLVVSCQEQRPGAAHRGNFLWRSKDEVVDDLNAVEFTLSYLIPMMIDSGDRLPADMRERVLESIRLGLEEVCRLDVAVTYTNIAAMDCQNSCLGGELLADESLARRGYEKFSRLADITAANGTVFEYHSPGYMLVTMRALKRLAQYTQDEKTRIRARTMAARLALSTALRIHPTMNRMAGPFSRAYPWQVLGESDPEGKLVRDWIEDGSAPGWIAHVLNTKTLPMQIEETAVADWDIGTTAYLSPSFAFGVATREVSRQSDVLVIHSVVPDQDRPVIIYSRYSMSDGPIAAPDRGSYEQFFDQGKFYGVQWGPRAIALYAPRIMENFSSFAPCRDDVIGSAKGMLIWSRRDAVDGIWVNGLEIESLPVDIQPEDVAVIATGATLVAVCPLTIVDLGYKSPIRIVEADDHLVLEMHNYLGPRKGFWFLDRLSRFYQGQPQCGFYVEVAERSQYPDGKSFCATVAQGSFTDHTEPPFTNYIDEAERLWTVQYKREGETLGIEIDLMQWKLKRRWTHEGDLGWPMLESPVARQNADGKVIVGDAVLKCGKNPAWLYADPSGGLWAAGYNGAPAPLTLKVPDGKVEIEAMGTGTVVWDKGKVSVEAIELRGTPTITGGEIQSTQR